MKIGIVLDDTLDSTDGVQQYVICLGEWLKQRGHEVWYLVGQTVRSDVSNILPLTKNVRVKFNGNRLTTPRPAPYRLIRSVMADKSFDVLHIQVPYSPLMSGRIIRLASSKVALVGTFHILPFGRLSWLGNGVLGKINQATALRFDAMMATSAPARDFAGRQYGFQSVVVSSPFHHDKFSQARRGMPSKNPVKRIVFLGRLVPRKGALQLLEAISFLRNQGPSPGPYEVVIAGKGPEAEKLQKFAREHDLTELVSFPGFIDESQKARLLARSDIAVFPSMSGESFGISLLEGMAASRGVVLAGNNPGYASVVADVVQLIDPTDTADFAGVLAKWLADDVGRGKMATKQQAHVRQFDIDVVGPKVEELYKKAIEARTSRNDHSTPR